LISARIIVKFMGECHRRRQGVRFERVSILGLTVAVCLFGLCGCGGAARQILVLPEGGVVAASSNSEGSRGKAIELIQGHCPGGYEIVREEEVPVGQRVREETRTDADRKDRVTSTTEYRMRTRYEWRIHYTCR